MKNEKIPLLGLLAFVFGLTAPSHAAQMINGAGATFPYPLYSKWFAEYQKIDSATQINYQSIGSGGGIRQFLEKTVDFGATDLPMTDEQQSKSPVPVLHIPTVLGAVVLTYNLPGAAEALRFDGAAVADLFTGKITKWNDARLQKLNPEAKLPDMPVMIVHRSDGSGTTGIFTDYLSKVSAEWKSKVGQGPAVSWPTGLGGKGNEGVTGLVKQTPGALGYVELIYAENNKLSYAQIKNKAGQFSTASLKSVTAAAQGALKGMPEDFRVSITDAEGRESYPIAGFTYLLVYKQMPKGKGSALVQFLNWAMKAGQAQVAALSYAPLPAALAKKVESRIKTIELK